MTDRADPPIDESSSGASDLRAQLHVEPLDEVTRARLVRNALAAAPAETAPSHQPVRWIAAAAAIVAVVAVGVSVLVRNSDAPQTTASAPASKSANDQEQSQEFSRGADSPSSESATAAPSAPAVDSQAAIPSLGNLGEVSRRAQLRVAVKAAKPKGRFTAACPTPAVGEGGASGVLISGGTGTVDGERASVYVVEGPDGGKVAVVVIDAGCRTALMVAL